MNGNDMANNSSCYACVLPGPIEDKKFLLERKEKTNKHLIESGVGGMARSGVI